MPLQQPACLVRSDRCSGMVPTTSLAHIGSQYLLPAAIPFHRSSARQQHRPQCHQQRRLVVLAAKKGGGGGGKKGGGGGGKKGPGSLMNPPKPAEPFMQTSVIMQVLRRVLAALHCMQAAAGVHHVQRAPSGLRIAVSCCCC